MRERQSCGASQSDEVLPMPLSKEEIVQEQKLDDFCQSVHTTQLSRKGTLYFEDEDGMLCRRHPRDQTMIQAVLPSSLRHRLLRLAHHNPIAGHPGQTRLHRRLRRSYYWPHTLEEICFKRLSMYVLDTFYLLRFPTLGVEFLHEKNINRM